MASNQQTFKNVVRSFLGEGPVADLFGGSRQTNTSPRFVIARCVSSCDPLALVFIGSTNANHGNTRLGNGPVADLVQRL